MPEWPKEDIDTLTELWNAKSIIDGKEYDKYSTKLIGQKIGRSKNAVVGKAGRLHLDPRADPIIRDTNRYHDQKTQLPPEPPKTTLAPLPSLTPPPTPPKPPSVAPFSLAAMSSPLLVSSPPSSDPIQTEQPARPTAAEPPAQRVVVFREPPKRHADGSGCSFPIGEPRSREFRYCDGDLSPSSRIYCDDHCNACFAKRKEQHDRKSAKTVLDAVLDAVA